MKKNDNIPTGIEKNGMSKNKLSKYVNFTDTDIDTLIDTFDYIGDIARSEHFIIYLNKFFGNDVDSKGYNAGEVAMFSYKIRDYIIERKNKLRVKTDIKIQKDNLIKTIFKNETFEPSEYLEFWIYVLLDYCFAVYEINEHINESEDNYRELYSPYLRAFDFSKIQSQ